MQASTFDGVEHVAITTPRPRALDDPGLRHVAMTVKDFEAAYSCAQFLGELDSRRQGHRVFFSDCEGNILHLIQGAHPLPA